MRPSAPRHARSPTSASRHPPALDRTPQASSGSREHRPRCASTHARSLVPASLLLRLTHRSRRRPAAGRGPRSARSSGRTVVEPAQALVALAADQRMLEQRKQRHRRKLFGRGRGNAEQQRAGRVSASGRPALSSASMPQRASNAETRRGKHPVRGDQRGRPARRLERLAQRQCDPLRFRRRICELGRADARQPPLGGLQALHLSLKSAAVMALATARPRAAAMPRARLPARPHFAARNAHALEQQLQMELRVGLLAAASLVGAERLPFLVGQHVRQRSAPEGRPCRQACARHDAAAPRPRARRS